MPLVIPSSSTLKNHVLGHHQHSASYTFPWLSAELSGCDTCMRQVFPTAYTIYFTGRKSLHMSIMLDPGYPFMLCTHNNEGPRDLTGIQEKSQVYEQTSQRPQLGLRPLQGPE